MESRTAAIRARSSSARTRRSRSKSARPSGRRRPTSSPTACEPAMRYLIGTSGYNYPEWRGSFYPEKFPTTKMLSYYAERFNSVEVTYTFYRVPTEKLLQGWGDGTPQGFTFTLKAPRRITHDSKLRNVADLTRSFCRTAEVLGRKLGVLLF